MFHGTNCENLEKGCCEEAIILATVAMLGRNNKQSDI